jgi:hypothetical protein
MLQFSLNWNLLIVLQSKLLRFSTESSRYFAPGFHSEALGGFDAFIFETDFRVIQDG